MRKIVFINKKMQLIFKKLIVETSRVPYVIGLFLPSDNK